LVIDLNLNHFIYTSLPDSLDLKTSSEERKKVLFFLVNAPPGKTYTAPRIAEACGFNPLKTAPKTRKIITELIECKRSPIVATNKGFKLARSRSELLEYYESLMRRHRGLMRRLYSVESIIAHLPEDYKGEGF